MHRVAESTPGAAVEALLKRNRLILSAGLALVVVLAWVYTLAGARMSMPNTGMHQDWSFGYAMAMFTMWWVMMVAMMLPSASPTILLSAAINRRSVVKRRPFGSTAMFTGGYLLVWGAFSLAAVLFQWWLVTASSLSMSMQIVSPYLAGSLLIVAGLWQLSPVKQACLKQCRSPVHFLVQNRRSGEVGALIMGAQHGIYCLGCCWSLMLLLFVGGVMNFYWIAGLSLYVLVEKLLRFGQLASRVAGVLLLVLGLASILMR